MKKKILIIILSFLFVFNILFFVGCTKQKVTISEETKNISINLKAKILKRVKRFSYEDLYHYLIHKKNYNPKNALNFISKEYGNELEKQMKNKFIAPKNAEFTFTKNFEKPFLYQKEVNGYTIDFKLAYLSAVKSLDGNGEVQFKKIEIAPELTEEKLKKLTAYRGEYSTYYSQSIENRKLNIKIASDYLNGQILEPKQPMSFNDVVGARTRARGFKEANIIFDGQLIAGVGGGVCQVSSTLYNATLISGLDVLAANRHSMPISYLPLSQDAMVTDVSDLVITNNTDSPIYIVSCANGKKLTFKFYGVEKKVTYKLKSKLIEVLPEKESTIKIEGYNLSDEILKLAKSNDENKLKKLNYFDEVKKKSTKGFISEAYRYHYQGDELIEIEKISHDTYYPKVGEIIRHVYN